MGEQEDRAAAIAAAKRAQEDAARAQEAASTAAKDAKKPYTDIPTAGVDSPTIGGWAKWVTSGGAPQASVHMDEVPGIVARAPGAALSAATAPSGFSGVAQGTEPMVSPGGGNSREGLDNDQAGLAADITLQNYLADSGGGQKTAPDFYRQQGSDYSSIGGTEGKSSFQKAFVDGPKELENSINAAEQAQAEKAKELGKVYDSEASRQAQATAATNARRTSDQQALEQRQQTLDKATQFYTDDLADQGKFWTNPGNIIAAISYSLLPIFGNDPAIGVKMINQAIDRDMANRQHAAQGTLGALRSNLAGYQKLTEDRQAGDMLADSEARRVAANEVARIAQKFESPISQAKAQAVIQDLRMKSEVSKMEAYKMWVNSPAQKMAAELHDARGKGFEGAYTPLNTTAPATAMGVKGTIDGTATTAQTGKTSGSTTNGFSSPQIAAIANADPRAAMKAVLDGRIAGSGDIAEMLRRQIAAEASTVAAKGPAAVAAKKWEIVHRADAERKESPELVKVAPRIAAIGSMQAKIDLVERSEAAAGRDPRAFLESARAYLPNSWVNGYEQYKARTGGTQVPGSAADWAAKRDFAKLLFREQMSAEVNSYIHANAGGAVSDQEAKRMSEVMNAGASLPEVKAFIYSQSIGAKREESAALSKLGPIAALMYRYRMGAGRNYQVDTEGRPPPIAAPRPGYDGGMSGSNSSQMPTNQSGGTPAGVR